MNSAFCDHLITWLNTFDGLVGNHHSAEDLSDGVAIAEVLTQIAPEWFDNDWKSKIKQDISPDNHRLKLSNLKKVLKGMLDYYSEVLFQDLESFAMPDVAEIAEFNNKLELGRMIQLVLGCAINCEEKEQYIQVIMALEEDVQLSVMNAIEELLVVKEGSKLSDTSLKDETDRGKSSLKSASFVTEKEQWEQKFHDLEDQIRILKDEKAILLLENEHLLVHGTSNEKSEGSITDKRITQLQFQIDKLKDENFTLETAKEEYKLRYDEKEKEVRGLNERIEQLSSLAEEARSLKDEMDILRHTQDKVARYEATIDLYKKKLDELGDMRLQMKNLEHKNEIYMQQTVALEEDSKKASTLKAQVDLYKTQIHDLHARLMDTEKRCDKAEFDVQRAKDRLQSMESENQRLKKERDMLKETNEELALNQTNTANATLGNSVGSHSNGMNFEDMEFSISPFEMKERLIRLEHQNKLYALQLQEAENEKTHVLHAELDVASERVNILETENRQLNQEILELKSQIEDMENGKAGQNEEISAEEKAAQKKLVEHLDALRESTLELQKKKQHIDELQSQTSANSSEISALRDQLSKKDAQMREMEERYKKYLDKAKTVIKTIEPKESTTDIQVNDLKSRLQEKEKLIEHLERDHERMKQTKEREEKLIISAWYELSMQLHRKAADERQVGSAGLSFLAKQRQAASIRRSSLSGTRGRGGS